MTLRKKLLTTLPLYAVLFSTLCFGQESYLIKKNIDKNISIDSTKKKKTDKLDKKEERPIKTDTPEKLNNTVEQIEKKKKVIKKETEQIELVDENKLRIIYKPNQYKLDEKELINVIELSNKLGPESLISLISYASKNNQQGSSDARRLSLSRALEVRKILIENEIPATNISVRALGTNKNSEGFTDIVIISID